MAQHPKHPSLVQSFRDAWEQQFPDLPWVEREILVPLPAGEPATEFTFVFTGLASFPLIDLVWRDGAPDARAPLDVDLQRMGEGMTLRLVLKGFDSRRLRGFRLRQQDDCRFGGVGVLQRDAQAWKTIYSSRQRCEAFKAFVEGWYEGRDADEQREIAPLLALATELAFGNVFEATTLIDQSADVLALVRANAWLPAKFGFEFVSHGLKRTFRFWGARARADYLREAADIAQALHALSQDTCLFGGAALGLQREGRLLPHDDDLDIFVAIDRAQCPDLGTALQKVAGLLERSGWQVMGYFFAHLWVKTRSGLGQTVDVFVGITEGDGISCYPLRRGRLERARMFPAAWRTLEGVAIPVPGDVEHYLEAVYGQGWRVPDPHFRLDWDRRPYADLAGNRAHTVNAMRNEQAFIAREDARLAAEAEAPRVPLAA